MADDHGAFTYICPNVDMIFGYVPDEVQAMGRIGSLLGDNLFDHAELTARGEIRNVEREVTAKSGERRTVLIHFKRVAIQNGTVLCTCRDVTELKQAEKELAAARLELAHAARLALVGELTASIFHEIQQPLAAIHINASAGKRLTRNPAAQPDLSEVASIFGDIHAESGHATEIIERIRALVRKRPLEMRSLDVNDAARDVLRLVAAEAQRRRVILRAELSEVLPAVVADRVSLQQVILNLIVNAIDAIGPESPARHVLVRTREDGNIVEVTVSDTGQGIAQRDLPKLFDPFFTTKKEGVGLGLAIARSIIEAHKGRIWAENNDGPGATFHMSLPVPPAISN
jgi:PAS domain S-box-containing protein